MGGADLKNRKSRNEIHNMVGKLESRAETITQNKAQEAQLLKIIKEKRHREYLRGNLEGETRTINKRDKTFQKQDQPQSLTSKSSRYTKK